jgi:hypothetical protein
VRRRPDKLAGPRSYELFRLRTARDPSDRLESWKEIAAYLRREVRTVQRWEKREGLPVHRHHHDERASIYAYKAELDAWWHNDHTRLETDQEKEEAPGQDTVSPVLVFEQGNGQPDSAKPAEVVVVRTWPLWWLWVFVAVAAVVASVVTIYMLKNRQSLQPGLAPRNPVVLASFENRTGDPVFDDALRQGLAAQLDQAPFLYIVSDQQIARTLQHMSRPANARLTPDVARQVCERMGDTAVLDGSIVRIGSKYSLVLEAVNCSTGESLARVQAMAKDKNHVLEALSRVAASMRSKLGKSLGSVSGTWQRSSSSSVPGPSEAAPAAGLAALPSAHGRPFRSFAAKPAVFAFPTLPEH